MGDWVAEQEAKLEAAPINLSKWDKLILDYFRMWPGTQQPNIRRNTLNGRVEFRMNSFLPAEYSAYSLFDAGLLMREPVPVPLKFSDRSDIQGYTVTDRARKGKSWQFYEVLTEYGFKPGEPPQLVLWDSRKETGLIAALMGSGLGKNVTSVRAQITDTAILLRVSIKEQITHSTAIINVAKVYSFSTPKEARDMLGQMLGRQASPYIEMRWTHPYEVLARDWSRDMGGQRTVIGEEVTGPFFIPNPYKWADAPAIYSQGHVERLRPLITTAQVHEQWSMALLKRLVRVSTVRQISLLCLINGFLWIIDAEVDGVRLGVVFHRNTKSAAWELAAHTVYGLSGTVYGLSVTEEHELILEAARKMEVAWTVHLTGEGREATAALEGEVGQAYSNRVDYFCALLHEQAVDMFGPFADPVAEAEEHA